MQPIRKMTGWKERERLLSEVSKYRALVENAADLFFLTEYNPSHMTILEVNERVCQVLGYTREEIISKSPMDFGFYDERFADTYKLVMTHLAETGFAKFEMRLKAKSGQMIPAEAITRIIELNGERVSISILRDMTERYQAEMALKESEERNRRLIELLPETVAVHTDGVITFVNETGVRMFGAESAGALIGKQLVDFIHPDFRDIVQRRVGVILDKHTSVPPIEQKLVKVDGTPFVAMVQSNEINYLGKPSVLVVAHDITERKLSEQLLRVSEERYRSMIELSPNAICLYNERGDIVFANDKAVNLFAAEHLPSLIGVNWLKLIHPGSRAESEERFKELLSGEIAHLHYENPCFNLNGESFFAEVKATCVHFDGEPVILAYIQDISARKEEEEKLQKANRMLMELSTLDGLTGISNRRHFEEVFEREWMDAALLSKPISIIMFDIDYFKLYNDTYGHQGGDACLKSIAACLKPLLERPGEVLARYGGEEFIVLLPNTDSDGARLAADSVKKQIEELRIPHKASKVNDCVTVSIGVATMIATPGFERNEMVEHADKALYQAKLAGRNRIFADPNFSIFL